MKKQSAEDYLDKLLNSVNIGEDTVEEVHNEIQPQVVQQEVSQPEPETDETQEDFLDSLLAEAEAMEKVDIDTEKESKPEMYSRKVTKSEEDFLMEFEAELEGEDFDDFLSNFDEELFGVEKIETPVEELFEETSVVEAPVVEMTSKVEEVPEMEENPMDLFGMAGTTGAEIPESEPSAMDSFNLGGVDLGALLSEATDSVSQEEAPMSEESVDVFSVFGESEDAASDEPPVDDVFASLFGEDTVGEVSDLDSLFSESSDSEDSIDLSNLGEADLMSLLAGDGDLSDLGDMLSQSDSSEVPMGGLDAFAAFAENEMSVQSEDAPEENKKKKNKKKAPKGKGGFFDKIKEFLFSDDDEDEDEVELKKAKAPSAELLSGENADILAQLEAEEKGDKRKKAKGGLFAKLKKDKKSKEEDGDKKGKKEKKPKKEKAPKKERKPKVPKEKKPKKPKEVDNTPPLPRGPVMLIWIMVISLFALIFIGTNLVGYSSAISEAKSFYNTGNYAEAYTKLAGINLKEKDMEIYNQVATLATVDSELDAYAVFAENEKYTEALDSLICAAGRCELNEDNADVYGCLGQMEILKKKVDNELSKYGMTYEQALEMYHIKDREDYTIALYTKLKELGLN